MVHLRFWRIRPCILCYSYKICLFITIKISVSYYNKAYHLIIKPGYFGNHGEICMLLNTSCNSCTVQTPLTTKTSESHMNGSSFVPTSRIFVTVIVHIIGNRKLKFTIIWSPQTEVCSVPYLHKNEFINAHHTMFVITMDEHTPTPVGGGGNKTQISKD